MVQATSWELKKAKRAGASRRAQLGFSLTNCKRKDAPMTTEKTHSVEMLLLASALLKRAGELSKAHKGEVALEGQALEWHWLGEALEEAKEIADFISERGV
jgi:hypothetical protein